MVKKEIGQVTADERDEIRRLFERRNGLNELARIVTADNTALYEKLVTDLGETSARFDAWWNRMAAKYAWEEESEAHWEIDFDTCIIYLVKTENLC